MQVALNVDCMTYMQTLADKSVDLAIADPPYFSGPERRGFYGRKVSPIGVHRDYFVAPKWEVPNIDFFAELARVSKKYIVWGCNYFDVAFPPGRIVWDKCNQNSSFSDCELAATNCHDSVRIFRYMWNGMFQGKSISEGTIQQGNKALNEKRIHPTQKPVCLYEWLLLKYGKKGWSILDTHLGSGSSRIAAYNLGFEFVGCEIDPICFELQEQRFSEYIAQERLW